MNEELLIIINYYDENITLFKENIDKLSEFFKNIVICNKIPVHFVNLFIVKVADILNSK